MRNDLNVINPKYTFVDTINCFKTLGEIRTGVYYINCICFAYDEKTDNINISYDLTCCNTGIKYRNIKQNNIIELKGR